MPHPKSKEYFELICVYCSRLVITTSMIRMSNSRNAVYRFRHLIPVTFLTGFYVTQVVTRYWDQFMSLPYTDILALKLVSFMPGHVGAKSTPLQVLQLIGLNTLALGYTQDRPMRP